MQETNTRQVLTLVADGLPSSTVTRATDALAAVGATAIDTTWLAPERACDLHFVDAVDRGRSSAELAAALAQVGWDLNSPTATFDWVIQGEAGRPRRLLVADMESTVIHNEMLDELADAIGRRQDMAAITARAMNDELDFEEALRQRVSWLAHLPCEALDRAAESIVIDAGAATLVATLKHLGVRTVLASGGFTFFAQPIADRLGFDACSANVLAIDDGCLTGEVVPPILDRQAKVRILKEHCEELGITPRQVVAVGDGANDLPMLQMAGLGVAYHGKPRVAAAAPANIRHGRLDTLLFFLGIPQSEWRPGNGVGGGAEVR